MHKLGLLGLERGHDLSLHFLLLFFFKNAPDVMIVALLHSF
jgi:hypothetical protein